MRKLSVYLVFIATMLPFLTGCDRKINLGDIPGTYIANHGLGEDTLIISADGTYQQFYVGKDGKRFENKNSWEVEPSDKTYVRNKEGVAITFNKFISAVTRFESMAPEYAKKYSYKSSPPGYWFVEVERTLRGTFKLCFDPDLDYCYIKQ